MVRSRDGEQPQKPGDKIKSPEPTEKKPKTKSEEKPSDPEAAKLLRLARTYLKTGKKTDAKRLLEQIVREFPGTPEAREAQVRLDNDFP
jgi:outer membrane protein assembly factor BamD (BamD/ComL family)